MKRRRKKKRSFVFGYLSAALLILCTGVVLSFQHGWIGISLKVKGLKIQGLNTVNEMDLARLSGIEIGDPLFGVGIDRALSRIMSIPRVESASVIRSVDGKVTIQVLERKASALINLDRLYYVDTAGNVLEPARWNAPESLDFTVFTGPWSGKAVDPDQNRIVEALRLKDSLVSNGIHQKNISEIHYDPSQGWLVFHSELKGAVVFGHMKFSSKVKRLKRVLDDFKGRRQVIRGIDLDVKDRAIVKLRKAA